MKWNIQSKLHALWFFGIRFMELDQVYHMRIQSIAQIPTFFHPKHMKDILYCLQNATALNIYAGPFCKFNDSRVFQTNPFMLLPYNSHTSKELCIHFKKVQRTPLRVYQNETCIRCSVQCILHNMLYSIIKSLTSFMPIDRFATGLY